MRTTHQERHISVSMNRTSKEVCAFVSNIHVRNLL